MQNPLQVAEEILSFCNQSMTFARPLSEALIDAAGLFFFQHIADINPITAEGLRCIISVANLGAPL